MARAARVTGEKAAGLKDDLGFPSVPADLTSGQFKSGPAVEDIFRTMSTGLSGTPMPSYRDSLPEEDRWALAYYVLALSAYKDPLTGEPLAIADADRAALNDFDLSAEAPDKAYVPAGSRAAGRGPPAPRNRLPPQENESWSVSRSPDPTQARC